MKMKNTLKAVLASASTIAVSAQAAIPAEATTAMTEVATDGAAMVGLGWAVAVAVTGGLVLIGIFKKTVNKAT